MREYFTLSTPTTPEKLAFFKAHKPIEVFFNEPLGGEEKAIHGKVIGPRGRVHSASSFWKLKWWLLEDEDDEVQAAMTRSLNRARKNYEECLAQDVQGDFDDEVQGEGGVGELHHLNQFGRGQLIASVGTGWKPKPIQSQWKLLGGASGKPMKKIGPKAKEAGGGKLHFITIS